MLLCCVLPVMADNNPVANPDAVVQCGNARFTVLTDRMIRMEWAADGRFEDNATLAIINRRLPVPAYTAQKSGAGLVIKTNALALEYKGGRFDGSNLSVSFVLNGAEVKWHPGLSDQANLRGTTRTLDGCTGESNPSYNVKDLERGLISRDGWAIVDESSRHILRKDDSSWGEWVDCRPDGDRLDLYILAYGHDYKAAVGDYTKVAGNVPLPPKYVFGYWWSKYWPYTDDEMREIALEMRERKMPVDVFVIDMDWHNTHSALNKRIGRDEFDQKRGWTGYTWNRDLIPDPEGLLAHLHREGYKIALNLHPASGIRTTEECYNAFVADYLSRTGDYDGPQGYIYGKDGHTYMGNSQPCGREGYRAPVPFRLSQQAWADAYFNSVIRPLERQGVDFWWLDWQQWRESKYLKNLSNTFWCNYAFWNDKVRQTRELGLQAARPLIYHRWGGLGSHRYQLGFSGDTYAMWSVLKYMPYFTSTASNVCYGYWGHDIGGHMMPKDVEGSRDGQLYTRWLQYGVFTPIFKTHSTKSKKLECRIWEFPYYYDVMKAAIDLRYALTPYIYNAARQTYDSGISMCRPMYYEYPEDDRAYTYKEQHFFGDDIIATCVCEPISGPDSTAVRTIWFPEGSDWYDMAKDKMHMGGSEESIAYKLNENPWYVRSGAVLPLAEKGLQSIQKASNELRLLVVPGDGTYTFTHYEDDGVSQEYVERCARTKFIKVAAGRKLTISVAAQTGSYENAPATRKMSVILKGQSRKAASVVVDGKRVKAVMAPSEYGMEISLPELSVAVPHTIVIVR